MVNLTVVNVKDVIKYLVKVTLIIVVVVTFTRFFSALKQNKIQTVNIKSLFLFAINEVIPGVKKYSNTEENKIQIEDTYKLALNSEMEITQKITNRTMEEQRGVEQNANTQDIIQIDNSTNVDESLIEENNNVEEIKTNLPTEVIDSKYNVYTCELFGVKIKNESKYQFSESDFDINNININKNNVLIFHTHTCESYTVSEQFKYEATGNYRTTDLNYSVSRVGDELEKYLTKFGFSVYHDKTYHDYPAYSGSYGRSLTTVKNLLKIYKDTDIVIDLHRDAIGDNTYAPKVRIGDEVGAQLMFVIGTDGSGLAHDNWKENLKFALQVQKKANEMYPGLFKPMIVRNSRYNHHLAEGACIIEVGATGNTMEECLVSMKYLSKVLDELL